MAQKKTVKTIARRVKKTAPITKKAATLKTAKSTKVVKNRSAKSTSKIAPANKTSAGKISVGKTSADTQKTQPVLLRAAKPNKLTGKPGRSAGAAAATTERTGRKKSAGITRPAVHAVHVLPTRVKTSDAPRKNRAGLSRKELDNFHNLLLQKRRDLVGDMSSMEREALRSGSQSNLSTLPVHMADMGTDNYEQEFTLGLVEKDRIVLREINQALAKIQDGTYGLCEGTGKPISKARLEAKPWARYSIEYTRLMEEGRAH